MSQEQDSPSCFQLSFEFSDACLANAEARCVAAPAHEIPVSAAKIYFLPRPAARSHTEGRTEAQAIQRLIARATSLPW